MHIEAPGDDKPVVVVENMSFRYPECETGGVSDVQFTLYPGDRVLLIGHNGCGKSTLLSLLGGKRKATKGSITVLGVDAFEETGLNHRVALLGPPWPSEAYFANTVETVASPTPNMSRKEAIATHLHLPLSAAVDKMSSGEKRRVQILHGMLHEAEVLLLDECSTDIDVAERKTVLDLVKRECMERTSTIGVGVDGDYTQQQSPTSPTYGGDDGFGNCDLIGHKRAQRACCIYATHILDGVEGWATHVMLMDQNRIIDFRKIDEISSLGYALPSHVLAHKPHSTTTVDGRGMTHSSAAEAVSTSTATTLRSNTLGLHVGAQYEANTAVLQHLTLEQYAHAFISKNRAREKRYRCYIEGFGGGEGGGEEGKAVATTVSEKEKTSYTCIPPASRSLYGKSIDYLQHSANIVDEHGRPFSATETARYSKDFIIRCRGVNIDSGNLGSDVGGGFAITPLRRRILMNAAIDIRRGSRTLLLGCNGSGKSTLLNMWGGKRLYIQPKALRSAEQCPQPEGQVVYPMDCTPFTPSEEEEENDNSNDAKVSMVAMPMGMYLNGVEMYTDMRMMIGVTTYGGDWWTKVPGGEMHVWDLVPQPMTLRAFEISNLLQINWSWDVRYLSSGEQKRVQLLLGLQYERPLVVLDEATADLDVDQRHELLKFLFIESVTKGTTVVYTTHIFEGLCGWASEIILLDRTVAGVKHVIPLETFEEAEDPKLFDRVTEELVKLKANEAFALRS